MDKTSLPIHPALFALSPVLFLLGSNIEKVSLTEGLLPGAVILMTSALLWLALSLVLRNTNKAALTCSLALIFFFSYGNLHDVFIENGWHIGGLMIGRHLVLLPLLVAAFYLLSLYVARKPEAPAGMARFLNATGAVLVAISLVQIGAYEAKAAFRKSPSENSQFQAVSKGDKNAPDIYYIILDGYANAETLKRYYSYDNSEFLKNMERMGFYVASESRSNYPMTNLSLASSLNMTHLTEMATKMGETSTELEPLWRMIQDSEVSRFLKSKGYSYIDVDSGFGPTSDNGFADSIVRIQAARLDRFSMLLLKSTALQPVADRMITNDLRNRHLYTFYKLAEMPAVEGPKFILAHMVVPHPPYVFGRNGEPLAELEVAPSIFYEPSWEPKAKYVDQLVYISGKVEWMVDQIIDRSKVKPIIIIQSDHGPAAEPLEKDRDVFIKSRSKILNLYYLPGDGDRELSKDITPVNTFRIIFNRYFGAKYERLPDTTYFSDYATPYKLTDISADYISGSERQK